MLAVKAGLVKATDYTVQEMLQNITNTSRRENERKQKLCDKQDDSPELIPRIVERLRYILHQNRSHLEES